MTWTGPELTALVTAIFAGTTTVITAIGVILTIYFNGRRADQTRDLGKAIDGRMTELLVEKGIASEAAGNVQGRRELHEENKAALTEKG